MLFVSWYGTRRDLHSFPTRRSSDLRGTACSRGPPGGAAPFVGEEGFDFEGLLGADLAFHEVDAEVDARADAGGDRKSTRLNSSHSQISYAVFCLKKKKKKTSGSPLS